jgi:SAM-dependent methyltransferase
MNQKNEKIPIEWGLNIEQLKMIYDEEVKQSKRLRIASDSERRKIYGEVYNEYFSNLPFHPQFTIKNDEKKKKHRVDSQLSNIKPFLNNSKTFIEIGAGDCSLSIEVSKFCKKVYALEVSDDIVKDIQFPHNVDLVIFDGFDIPLADNSIDLAYSNQLMEHLHPDDAIDQIKSIHRVLKPGGKYICITPNGINGPHDISRFFGDELVGFHLKEYTATELKELFLSLGFKKCKAFILIKNKKVELPWFLVTGLENLLLKKPMAKRKEMLQKGWAKRIFNCVVYAEK